MRKIYLIIFTVILLSLVGCDSPTLDNGKDQTTTGDTVPPVITLGEFSTSLPTGGMVQMPNATCTDDVDVVCTVLITGAANEDVPGDYIITFTATDEAGNVSSTTATITVRDTEAPITLLVSSYETTLEYGSEYIYPAVSCTSTASQNCTVSVGTIDPDNLGSQTYTIIGSDDQGNRKIMQVTVVVADTENPDISLLGDETLYINLDDPFVDPWVDADDNYGIDTIEADITTIDTSTEATYTITYTATDMSGNTSLVARTVIVFDDVLADPIDMLVDLIANEDGAGAVDLILAYTSLYPDQTTVDRLMVYGDDAKGLLLDEATLLANEGDYIGAIGLLFDRDLGVFDEAFSPTYLAYANDVKTITIPSYVATNQFILAKEALIYVRYLAYDEAGYLSEMNYIDASLALYLDDFLTVTTQASTGRTIYNVSLAFEDVPSGSVFGYTIAGNDTNEWNFDFTYNSNLYYICNLELKAGSTPVETINLFCSNYTFATSEVTDVGVTTYTTSGSISESSFVNPDLFKQLFENNSVDGTLGFVFLEDSGVSYDEYSFTLQTDAMNAMLLAYEYFTIVEE